MINNKTDMANVIVNKFADFTEILVYKEPFMVNLEIDTSVDRTRKFIYDEDGVLCPIKDSVKISDLKRSLQNSRVRAVDNFYGYALTNDWNYFITLTFSNKYINRLDENSSKYLWEKFRKKLQYHFKDIKIIVVAEEHKKDKAIHFHGFVGNCNFDENLVFAVNNQEYLKDKQGNLKFDKNGNKIPNKYYKELLRTKFGDAVYNFKKEFYDYGFSTVVKIRPDSSKLQVTNYLTKYFNKDTAVLGYNKKLYYRTHNLNFKDKFYSYQTEKDLVNLLSNEHVEVKKDTERFISFVVPNNKGVTVNKSIYDYERENKKERLKQIEQKVNKLFEDKTVYAIEQSQQVLKDVNNIFGDVEQINIDDIF